MKIRFLQSVPSDSAMYPFVAGQVIDVACPSAYLLSLLDGERAEVVRDIEDEQAVIAQDEQPEPVRKRRRAAR